MRGRKSTTLIFEQDILQSIPSVSVYPFEKFFAPIIQFANIGCNNDYLYSHRKRESRVGRSFFVDGPIMGNLVSSGIVALELLLTEPCPTPRGREQYLTVIIILSDRLWFDSDGGLL